MPALTSHQRKTRARKEEALHDRRKLANTLPVRLYGSTADHRAEFLQNLLRNCCGEDTQQDSFPGAVFVAIPGSIVRFSVIDTGSLTTSNEAKLANMRLFDYRQEAFIYLVSLARCEHEPEAFAKLLRRFSPSYLLILFDTAGFTGGEEEKEALVKGFQYNEANFTPKKMFVDGMGLESGWDGSEVFWAKDRSEKEVYLADWVFPRHLIVYCCMGTG